MDFQELNNRLIQDQNFLSGLYPEGKIMGSDFRVGNISGKPGDSLSINMENGKWYDHATGEKGGDLISLLAAKKRLSQKEAFQELEKKIGNFKPKGQFATVSKKARMSQTRPQHKKETYAEAEKRAKEIWEQAKPIGEAPESHPYLLKKKIKAYGIRVFKDGRIVAPVLLDEIKVSLQFITGKGDKRFLKGGRIKGGSFPIGAPKEGKPIYITEGYSTAATIYEATNALTVVAFDAGNLLSVAKQIKDKYPSAQIIICADDDFKSEGNPGLTAANKAASEINAKVAIPKFKGKRKDKDTDFNDLYCLEGKGAVLKCLRNPLKPEIKEGRQEEKKKGPLDNYQIARKFLAEQEGRIVFYQGDFFIFSGNGYIKLPKDKIKSLIVLWLIKNEVKRPCIHTSREVLYQLEGRCLIHDCEGAFPPFELKIEGDKITSGKFEKNKILVKNGILDLKKAIDRDPTALSSHSDCFFCPPSPMFGYNPKAKEPKIFLKYLEEVQPDVKMRMFLQEWLGYCLTFDTEMNRFVFFIGEGSNGKSVFLLIMRLIIGEKNISSVSLEGFKESSRFLLAQTHMKKANIIGDLSEIDKAEVGRIKKFTSGEAMQVEKKHQTPFDMIPTAKLTFAMNTLPQMIDRSDGIWRRLILVRWNEKIPPEKQNKNFLRREFWEESGELEGILNLAIEGLKRVIENKGFTESVEIKRAVEEYKEDSNPAMRFILGKVEPYSQKDAGAYQVDHNVWASKFYKEYKAFCEEEGLRPMSSQNLNKEIKRLFPYAEKEKKTRKTGDQGNVDRLWRGIKLIDSDLA